MSAIRNEDLVLRVSTHIDRNVWDEGKYDAFVDELCGSREYQKEAVFTALRFLAGGKCKNLRELARENFDSNPKLEEAYGSWPAMEAKLQFPDMLACSLDMATGTGKSYVLYGIAAIMLAEGLVDRVLVLCPSNTIERGLTDKFKILAASADLQENMPENARYLSPKVINATETIVDGCVCVENYHAVLKHVKSSIHESLNGKGGRSLVLNDETHHVYVKPTESRKWKDFLLSKDFGFRYVVGVSGTCYRKNDYFPDVVSRYSLRQAIEERAVKEVEYVTELPRLQDPNEKWQLIYQRHKRYRDSLGSRSIRPLTIIVTNSIGNCERVAEDLMEFLQSEEKITTDQVKAKALVVTSSPQHHVNLAKLSTVDSSQSKVEWIVSVSMLTEGWDVKNVFQIVPHEERAFNSKLLIAQVLGRGLRVPENWQGQPPVVTIFNHHAWASNIKKLVDEVLDMERRISSVPLKESDCHFELHNLEYEKLADSRKIKRTDTFNLFERDYIDLPSVQAEEPVEVGYERVKGTERREQMNVRHKTFTSTEVAEHVHQRLKSIDEEFANKEPKKITDYAKRFTAKRLKKILESSTARSGIDNNRIPDEIRQKFLQAVGVVRREASSRVSYTTLPKSLIVQETRNRHSDSCSAAELHRDKSVFCRSDCEKYLPQEQRDFYHKLADPDGEFKGKVILLDNDFDFKTPFNLAIADSEPERRFIRRLCRSENARCLDGWMKNTALGFYSIEYAWSKPTTRKRGASHIKRGAFSPDFFVRQDDKVFVVEIKHDNEVVEPSPENVAKYKFAIAHFQTLNKGLKDTGIGITYRFNMLTPDDYLLFFERLRDQRLDNYHSRLDAAILSSSDTEDLVTSTFGELDVVRINTDAYEKEGLKHGEEGTIVLVHKENGKRGYEVEFDNWTQNWPVKVKTLAGDEIEMVKKWSG